MEIEIVDGFKMISTKNGKSLLIESERLNEYLQYAVEKRISSIALLEYHGYKLPNVDFLREHNSFTEIWVKNYLNDIDMSAVHYLNKLKYLTLSNGKQNIDFGCFPVLVAASVDWNNKIHNFHTCKQLKELTLWKYKPKSASLMELKDTQSLNFLKITESNINSLSGIDCFPALVHFEAYFLSKLESLAGIEGTLLRTLILENCKKLKNFEPNLVRLKNLEKLILGNCGELNDIHFITEMPNLRFFSFVGTNVREGDLSPLQTKKFDYVGFDDKKHYSHKMKEINPSFQWKI